MEEPKVEVKKCTNCTRAPQPLKEFINEKERECNTCNKCRNKGKKNDGRQERRETHNALQKERRYDTAWRAKQLEERPEEFRNHNNKVHTAWRVENAEHLSRWYRTHVNPRLDAVKRSAATRGIEWNLSDEEAKVMMTSPCIYCKHIDLDVRVNGIDRLDSGKSYCTENCRPCCKNCNSKTFIEHARKIAECAELFPGVTVCGDHKKNLRKSKDDASIHGIDCDGARTSVQDHESICGHESA